MIDGACRGELNRFAIASGRCVPEMYVVDASCGVLLRGSAGHRLGEETVELVRELFARARTDAHPGAVVLSGGDIVRIVPLEGGEGRHYALFVERVASRAPVALAAQRFALTARETDVLAELVRGARNGEIAVRLGISEATVNTHVRNIGIKMPGTKRKEIVATVIAMSAAVSSKSTL